MSAGSIILVALSLSAGQWGPGVHASRIMGKQTDALDASQDSFLDCSALCYVNGKTCKRSLAPFKNQVRKDVIPLFGANGAREMETLVSRFCKDMCKAGRHRCKGKVFKAHKCKASVCTKGWKPLDVFPKSCMGKKCLRAECCEPASGPVTEEAPAPVVKVDLSDDGAEVVPVVKVDLSNEDAALEDDSEEANIAAITKLQAIQRGRAVRATEDAKAAAVTKLQAIHRGKAVRVAEAAKIAAAIKIQAVHRGRVVRQDEVIKGPMKEDDEEGAKPAVVAEKNGGTDVSDIYGTEVNTQDWKDFWDGEGKETLDADLAMPTDDAIESFEDAGAASKGSSRPTLVTPVLDTKVDADDDAEGDAEEMLRRAIDDADELLQELNAKEDVVVDEEDDDEEDWLASTEVFLAGEEDSDADDEDEDAADDEEADEDSEETDPLAIGDDETVEPDSAKDVAEPEEVDTPAPEPDMEAKEDEEEENMTPRTAEVVAEKKRAIRMVQVIDEVKVDCRAVQRKTPKHDMCCLRGCYEKVRAFGTSVKARCVKLCVNDTE